MQKITILIGFNENRLYGMKLDYTCPRGTNKSDFLSGFLRSIPIRARSSPVICANQIARQFGAFNPSHARATKLSRCNSCERAKKENAAWQAVVRASIERLSCEIYLRGR